MLNKNWYKSLGIVLPLLSAILLFGLVDPKINLFSTGITLGMIFGIAQIFIFYAIWKHRV